jgi:hypothetical protein
MDKEFAESVYYDWVPAIMAAAETCQDSPRHYHLRKLLDQLGVKCGQGGGGEKTHHHP